MKVFKALLFISLSILFFSCGDDDSNNKNQLTFSASNLKQTGWEGEILILSNGEVDTHGDISMEFTSESTGVCECKLDYFIDPEIYSFAYEIKDRLIYINNTPPYIGGGWILQKFDNDSLIIAQSQALTTSELIRLKRLY